MLSIGSVAARIKGTLLPAMTGRSACSTNRAYWRMRTFWPSEPWIRPEAVRSVIEALPAALATSEVGR